MSETSSSSSRRSAWFSVFTPSHTCAVCSHLGDVSKYGGTLTWDYTGINALGTVVTLTCGAGLATPDLNTTQTLTCGLNGWNQAVPCSGQCLQRAERTAPREPPTV